MERTVRVCWEEVWQVDGYLDHLALSLREQGVEVLHPHHPEYGSAYAIFHYHVPHFHWPGSGFYRVSFVAFLRFVLRFFKRKLLGKKAVWTAHDPFDNRADRLLSKICNAMLARYCDAIICHGYATKEMVVHLGAKRERIRVIAHPSFVNSWPNTVCRAEARELLALPEDKRIFLFLGNVRREKGIEELVSLFKRVQDGSAMLVIAGEAADGALAHDLKRECWGCEYIRTYFGYVPVPLLQVFFNAADVAVFPYLRIGTSGAVILAMGFGKPVIAADINCLGEVVAETTGWKYPAGERDVLEKCLRQAMKVSDGELREMGANAFSRVKDATWDKIAAKYVAVYQSVLAADQAQASDTGQ